MTAMILPAERKLRPATGRGADTLLQVSVHLQTTVLAPDTAQHKANVWLSMNAGHLLLAENPELMLSDLLQWRFGVVRSLRHRNQPHAATRTFVGRMHMDAETGAVIEPVALVEELIANADASARNTA